MSKFLILVILLVTFAVLLGAVGLGISYLDTKTVRGTVTDENGAPVANAILSLAGRSTFSDAHGGYQLQVPRGTWDMRAFADGFQSEGATINAADFLTLDYVAGFKLKPQEWRGQILASDTNQPISDARVELDGKTLTTDDKGEFVAFGVRNGSQVQVSRPGYRTTNVTVQSVGGPGQTAVISLAPAELKVLVVDASNQQPLPGVRVQANGSSANTDANGTAVLHGLTEGASVSAQAPGYAKTSVDVAQGAQLTLALQPTILHGKLLDAATKQPIAGAMLTSGSAEGAPSLRSDANGSFTIEDFSAAPKLYVKKPGYALTELNLTQGGAQDFTLTPFKAKGIHLYYGIKRADAERILDQFKGTEMNAVVFDVKEDPGYILWDSKVPLAQQIGAYVPREYTANQQVETCRAYKLYCIARLTVFKDSLLAQQRPDLALHNAAGGLLYENVAYWTNPGQAEVQDYHIALAKELAAMGFDEIQYDYIRFPGTREVLAGEFGDADYRVNTIENFLQKSSDALRPTHAFFSGDVFGLTTAVSDEQGIGQVWENVAPPFDYISPMMYPSTWRYSTDLWGRGFGITNCSDSYACPYEIMRYGTLKAQERTLNNWTLVRPWLQAYQMGLGDMLKQAQGSDDADSAGYLFWNNAGVYQDGLFK